MNRLLSAGFARLWRDRLFWIAFGFVSLGSILFSFLTYRTSRIDTDAVYHAEDLLFNMLPVIGFICAFFISLHLGTEFDDNTIRNKLIVGHTRGNVFFSEYVICLTASLVLLGAMLLLSGVCGYAFFRVALLEWADLLWLLLCCALLTAVFSAIFVGIGMNASGRAHAVVASILILFGILFIASYCGNGLAEPAKTYTYVTFSTEGAEFGDLIDNPAYVDGFRRTIYEMIYDLLPTGQSMQINNLELERMARWPWLSLCLLAPVTLLGWAGVKRRNVK